MSFIPALIGAGGSLLGGLIGGSGAASAGAANAQAIEDTNKTNLQLQQNQQSWEQSMANSSYQRAVADMKAAGINPMLAVQNGGAVTPNVAPAQMQSPGAGGAGAMAGAMGSAVSGAVGSAMDMYMKTQQATNLKLQGQNVAADTALKSAQTATEGVRPANVASGTSMNLQSASNAALQARNISAEYTKLDNEIHNIIQQGDILSINRDQAQALMPLIIQAQTLDNQKAALGNVILSPEAEKARTFFGEKISPYIGEIGKILGSVGGGAVGGALMRRFGQSGSTAPAGTFDYSLSQ